MRRLLVLISGLPDGARIFKDWSQEEHLLGLQVDLMNTMVWQNYLIGMALGLKKKHFNKPPKPMERPQDKEAPKERVFAEKEDFDRMLGMFTKG